MANGITFDEKAVFSIMARHKVPKNYATAMVEVLHHVRVDNRFENSIELIRRDTQIIILRDSILAIAFLTGFMAVMFSVFG